MEYVDLVGLIEQYDLALVDASFLDGNDGGKNLASKIYAIKTFTELEEIGEELNANHMHWSWMKTNILQMKGVATISGVVEELKQLRIHLKNSYLYFSSLRYKNNFDGKKIPKKRAELDFDQSSTGLQNSLSKPTLGLNALYQFMLQIGRSIKKIKKYHPTNNVDRNVHPMRKDISLTDYMLVDAGIDYLRLNPTERVGIFTRDQHHVQILDDYLDQRISLPRGELAVYRFCSGKVQDGSLWLKEGLVSESVPADNYHLKTINPPEAMEKVAGVRR